MTENDYILVAALTNLRLAQDALRNVNALSQSLEFLNYDDVAAAKLSIYLAVQMLEEKVQQSRDETESKQETA